MVVRADGQAIVPLDRSWINFCKPMRISPSAAVLVVLALGEPAAQVFKVDTELVTIPITVTTRDNERVSDLTAADFQVREDGVEQTIAFVDQQRRALSLCIVLDSSVSMRG